jgi:F0F1-type ATP synthase assembly protein I
MAQSGCLIVAIVLIAVIAGIFLDRILNTRPLLTLLMVLGSIPVTIFVMYRLAMQAVSAVKPGTPKARKDWNDDDEA